MKSRNEAREIAVKCLYKISILEDAKIEYDPKDVIQEECEVESDFINELVYQVLKYKEDLDKLANKYLVDWEIKRLNKVDQAILRIGIYELRYTDTPNIVAINEAIELSKKYSDEEVTKMINAVLDNIYHSEDTNE